MKKKTGVIKKELLSHLLSTLGSGLTEQEIAEMCSEADLKNTGEIEFCTFIDVMNEIMEQ